MRLYIAGPMTGLPFFNFPAFDEAESLLKGLGITAWSPAANDRSRGLDETKYPTGDVAALRANMPGHMEAMFRWDVDRILNSEGILRLPGWHDSIGTLLELSINKAIGGRVFEGVYIERGLGGIVEVFGD